MSLFSRPRDSAPLPVEGRLPGFNGATGWLNSPALAPSDLRGKVVLVDFWTYTCINWLRTLAYVRAWADRYRDEGLVVVGVHTPEFPFERDADNVRRAVQDMAIEYPVALDPDFEVWRAFENQYWPAAYFADVEGRIRHHQFGEGGYEECEAVIQRLLHEAGRDGVADDLVSVTPAGFEAQADWGNLESPETYVGYEQGRNFASPGFAADEPRTYVVPEPLNLNDWALAGDWTITSRAGVLEGAEGSIAYHFHARDAHLVISPGARDPIPFRVLLDGQAPRQSHGVDVDEDGNGLLRDGRLYQLVRQHDEVRERTLEITFLEPGAEAYAFTFG